jgi:hypothetical protein
MRERHAWKGVRTVTETRLELGRRVRWRGRRWRVAGEERNGLISLVGADEVNREQTATPLVTLEGEYLDPDQLPLPPLDVASSDRGRWRALHQAYLADLAGGREQMVGLDWGAVTVEPYQLVPLLRVARTIRARLLIADDTGLGKTAEAGLILRWLAQRHQAARVLIVTRAAPEPERWQRELRTKFGFEFDILQSGADFAQRRKRNPTVNVYAQSDRMIVSMTLAARQVLLDELRQCPAPFDVVIVDEAHHLAQHGSATKRLAVLGRQLAQSCSDGTLLLLTATPHDGKTESFLSLIRLLDPFAETEPGEVPVDLASRPPGASSSRRCCVNGSARRWRPCGPPCDAAWACHRPRKTPIGRPSTSTPMHPSRKTRSSTRQRPATRPHRPLARGEAERAGTLVRRLGYSATRPMIRMRRCTCLRLATMPSSASASTMRLLPRNGRARWISSIRRIRSRSRSGTGWGW